MSLFHLSLPSFSKSTSATLRLLLCCLSFSMMRSLHAQPDRWQQRIGYVMDVHLDVQTDLLQGKQTITYTNNSPDTLTRVFMFLYWNSFKPGSMMDVWSRSTEKLVIGQDRQGRDLTDWDRRYRRKIYEFKPEDEGYCNVTELKWNGSPQQLKVYDAILEVRLDKPILPKSTVTFQTKFESKVPLLSRRSGKNSLQGIRYSMGQWYPKMAEYDAAGWHPDDHVGREYYGVWGDYDVSITLDKDYKVGGSGVLQNAAAIGWGYDKEGTPLKAVSTPERTWRFVANNVHDFVWAADPEYKHITRKVTNGPLLHFIYKQVDSVEAKWQHMADSVVMAYPFMAKTFGPYPYPVYSFIQGGGGGTEYPMATLMIDPSLTTALHEWCHSWYQMMMGTNEVLFAWMDEGFSNYADSRTTAFVRKDSGFVHRNGYAAYYRLVTSKLDEPMATNANMFNTNFAYNNNAYQKGHVFMAQLGYVVGDKTLDKILLAYYQQWRFRHPEPNDFIRVAEKVSGMQLQWYKEYMIYTNKTIDYAIDSLWSNGSGTNIRINKIGRMPMPVDVTVTFKDGSREQHYVPLNLMFGQKMAEDTLKRKVYEPWRWTDVNYVLTTDRRITDIVKVEIDPSLRLADVDRKNNVLEIKW